jgi:hypothetical protein
MTKISLALDLSIKAVIALAVGSQRLTSSALLTSLTIANMASLS